MRKAVLIALTRTFVEAHCSRAVELLKQSGFEVIYYEGSTIMTPEEIKAVGSEIYGVIACTEAWTEDVFSACPNLKIIARFGSGYDNVDLEAAKRRGIIVVNARGRNSEAVAEMTLLHVLALYRNLMGSSRAMREGGWPRGAGRTVRNKVYGLLGFGAIAQNVARLLSGFEPAEVIACDPYPQHEAAKRLGVRIVSFDELIEKSDILSIHIPATPETRGIIGTDALRRMKRSAILINVARGAIVDESALCEALREGWIAGAGLDVYEQEPVRPDNPLLALENVVLTPHVAADAVEVFDEVGYFCARMIMDVFAGREPENWLNK